MIGSWAATALISVVIKFHAAPRFRVGASRNSGTGISDETAISITRCSPKRIGQDVLRLKVGLRALHIPVVFSRWKTLRHYQSSVGVGQLGSHFDLFRIRKLKELCGCPSTWMR